MRISDWSSDVCSSDLIRDLRRGVAGQHAQRARIGEGLDRAPDRREAARAVEAERRGLIERARMHPDARDALAPGARQRVRHQPAAVALPAEVGPEAALGKLTSDGVAKLELEHPDPASPPPA